MNIAILLYPQFTALDAIGPMEVLSSLPGANVRFVAEACGPMTNDTRLLTVQVDVALDDQTSPDIVLVPGGPGCMAAMEYQRLLDWIRAAHAHTRWTTSVCTGSLILGAAGLLHGLLATTHWASAADLPRWGATYHPGRFVRQGRIITAAGVSAGIDMALALSHELAGPSIAQGVQLLLEYDPQPPQPMPSASRGSDDLAEPLDAIWRHRMRR